MHRQSVALVAALFSNNFLIQDKYWMLLIAFFNRYSGVREKCTSMCIYTFVSQQILLFGWLLPFLVVSSIWTCLHLLESVFTPTKLSIYSRMQQSGKVWAYISISWRCIPIHSYHDTSIFLKNNLIGFYWPVYHWHLGQNSRFHLLVGQSAWTLYVLLQSPCMNSIKWFLFIFLHSPAK
jgi:hypothetical protein